MTHPATAMKNAPVHKPRPMVDLLVSIVIPSVILMKFSGNDAFGATTVLDVGKIKQQLETLGNTSAFENRLLNATYLLSGTFFFSAAMNYSLATWIVTSPAGSAAFNEELGRLTLLSYPVIAIPSMLMMLAIFYYLWRTIHGMTGLALEEILASRHRK